MQCFRCGKFLRVTPGAMWQMVYSSSPMPEPDGEIYRCEPCVAKHGELQPQPGIVPKFSIGYLKPQE